MPSVLQPRPPSTVGPSRRKAAHPSPSRNPLPTACHLWSQVVEGVAGATAHRIVQRAEGGLPVTAASQRLWRRATQLGCAAGAAGGPGPGVLRELPAVQGRQEALLHAQRVQPGLAAGAGALRCHHGAGRQEASLLRDAKGHGRGEARRGLEAPVHRRCGRRARVWARRMVWGTQGGGRPLTGSIAGTSLPAECAYSYNCDVPGLTGARGGQLAVGATPGGCRAGMVGGIRVQRQRVGQPVAARQEVSQHLPALPGPCQVLESACRSRRLLSLQLHAAAATAQCCLLLARSGEEPAKVGGPAKGADIGDHEQACSAAQLQALAGRHAGCAHPDCGAYCGCAVPHCRVSRSSISSMTASACTFSSGRTRLDGPALACKGLASSDACWQARSSSGGGASSKQQLSPAAWRGSAPAASPASCAWHTLPRSSPPRQRVAGPVRPFCLAAWRGRGNTICLCNTSV